MVHSPVWVLLCLSTFMAGIGFFASVGLCVLCQTLLCKHLVDSRVTSSSQTKKGRTESWVKIKPTELKYCIWYWLEPKSSYLLLNAVTKVTKQDINSGCPEKKSELLRYRQFSLSFIKMIKIRPSINFHAKFWLINQQGKNSACSIHGKDYLK